MEGRYKPYPKYKDSGANWLGEIPSGWGTIPIGRLFRRIKRTGYAEKELLSVYRDFGVIPKSSRDDNNNKPSEDLSPYQLVMPDDLVMNKMKTWQGSIAISSFEGIVSPAYFVYQPNSKLYDLAVPYYVHFLLRNPIYITQYLRLSKGIRVNQWDLEPEEFQRIELLLPSIPEQEKIAAFLDYETAKIDALIKKQERLIELLEEKRQVVISHAVTKGLNPDAPMKPSGIDWLGDVPEHWEVAKVKYFARMFGGYAFDSNSFKDSGVQLLRIGNLYLNSLSLERQPIFLDERLINVLPNFCVYRRDILISLTGTLGKRDYGFAIIVDHEGPYLLNQRVAKLVPDCGKISREYLLYSLRSDTYLNQLYSLPSGTKQANLSNADVLNIEIAVPPKEEQQKIAVHVRSRASIFQSAIRQAQRATELLKERRTALISAAVTGKIDVRDWQAPDAEQKQDTRLSEDA